MSNNIILIADDEPWQRMWLSQVLHQAGYTCSTVAHGEDVVEQALALDPGLIIMDIELPGISGIAAAQQLRILPNTRELPVLFITSYTKARDVLLRSDLGPVEWLLKPFHPEELLTRVRRLLRTN